MLHVALALATHTLLDPTPDAELRPLRADRPDLTEGPYTIDPGHLQFETDFGVIGTEGPTAPVDVDVLAVVARVGLTDSVDVHATLPVVGGSFGADGIVAHDTDLTLRAKWNFLGNEPGGDLAIGLLGFVVVPPDYVVSAGMAVPVEIALPADLALGTMLGVEAVRDGNVVDADLSTSLNLSGGLTDEIGAYVEAFGHGQAVSGAYEVWASAGSTYSVSKDIQLDAGARLRVLGDALRAEGFVGLTLRR